jgi:hypothetical protein
MTARRLSSAAIERLVDQLGPRDRLIWSELARVGVLTGAQLTRLRFSDLSPSSRDRTRRRVLARLTALDVTATLDRRIGGVRAGSAGLVYTLGLAGQRLAPFLAADDCEAEPTERPRHPWTPGVAFLAHALDMSELYIQLRECERSGALTLADYAAEPATWQPHALGGYLKPDAYAVLRAGDVEDSWWIEVDRATESLPTLRRKLLGYLDYVNGGQLGPAGVVPRVLLTVPHNKRLADAQQLVDDLPNPASQLIVPALFSGAINHIVRVLRE